MRMIAAVLAFLMLAAPVVRAAPADGIADTLVAAVHKPAITPDTLSSDFARLTRFVRHDANGAVVFSDGGPTNGYVRYAIARFETAPAAGADTAKTPPFSIALEFTDQEDFNFASLAAALEQRLGTPNVTANQSGAVFRTWLLSEPAGRSLQLARSQGSDNGDPVIVVDIIQSR